MPFGQSMEPFRRALSNGIEGWAHVLEQMLGELPPAMEHRLLANDVAGPGRMTGDV